MPATAGRIRRAIRAGFPILVAALVLGGAALASSSVGSGRQSPDLLVVGIGDSTSTAAISPFDETTVSGGHKVFVISGNVDGLYPGGTATLALRLRNPLGKSISVNTLSIIGLATKSGCAASYLAAGTGLAPLNHLYTITLSPPLVVASGQSLDGPHVPITLIKAAPDACQNATFLLLYGGTATSADEDNDFDGGQTDDDNQSDEP